MAQQSHGALEVEESALRISAGKASERVEPVEGEPGWVHARVTPNTDRLSRNSFKILTQRKTRVVWNGCVVDEIWVRRGNGNTRNVTDEKMAKLHRRCARRIRNSSDDIGRGEKALANGVVLKLNAGESRNRWEPVKERTARAHESRGRR